ncbi:MAG TPA: hypothetical protein VKT22_07095 [Steroidobacteraceae bacterium]|nr:hypothetical protein [Steroidobacteraceae bacterium]
MQREAIGLARLMRESTDCIEAAVHDPDAPEQLVARRVLESPLLWQQWESEHSMLMRQLASCAVRRTQVSALKETTFRLLHGRALFHFMRTHRISGSQRVEILAHFRPGRSFDAAIIAEHGVYLRKACSYLCAGHLGREVIADPAFLDPMQRYEELYTEYFDLYCSSLIGGEAGEAGSQRALLPLLKKQLGEYRQAILDPKAAQPFLRREQQLRRPTGDTQRLPLLGRRPR